MTSTEMFLNQIDDYSDTIVAILGFLNFYRYDDVTKRDRTDVLVFQGRKLTPSAEKAKTTDGQVVPFVTPDLGVVLPSNTGVLGEVKATFPRDETYLTDRFKQLLGYDDDLTGWPGKSPTVTTHDIVLLLHYSRAVTVEKFYLQRKGKEIVFHRPFCIVEFQRTDQRQPYFSFRIKYGSLSEKAVSEKLEVGVQVPMEVLLWKYSTIKLYDAEPPLPYMLEVVWTNVVMLHALDDPKFVKLRKNQKLEVELEVETIVNELHERFSFLPLHVDKSDRQPHIPKKSWVQQACQKLVDEEEAAWVNKEKTKVKIYFRKYEDVLEHFIELCGKEAGKAQQVELLRLPGEE
jgi:hypothetical protein